MVFPTRFSPQSLLPSAAAVVGAGLITIAPVAGAVTFSITDAVLTIGSGYGKDGKERHGDRLGVKFSNTFSLQNRSLDVVGEAFSFDLGTVKLAEPAAFGGITSNELDRLDVSWALTLGGPVSTNPVMVAAPSAAIGEVNRDTAVDYALDWSPVTVDFGFGGQFEISLNDLEFRGKGKRTQTATITLLALPTVASGRVPAASSVPVPGTIALFTLGLAGIGAARRKKLAK